MLRNLSNEVRYCYAHANACASKAAMARDEERRKSYLRLQERWLILAQSYAFEERLLDFSKENQRKRAEFYGQYGQHQ
jgi:hypothetical protein